MSKLARFTQLLFGNTAGGSRIAVFGSLAAGSPTAYAGSAITPSLIQQDTAAFAQGLDGAVIASNSPALQDHNALFYLYAYQLSYLMQQGIPEYDGGTVYFSNSLVMGSTGIVYQAIYSIPTGFSGVSPPNGSYWVVLADKIGSQMTSVGANAVGNTRTRLTQGSNATLGNIAVSASCGSFSISGTAPSIITNLNVFLDVGQNPVMLVLQPDTSSTGSLTDIQAAIVSPVGKALSIGFNNATTGTYRSMLFRGSPDVVFPGGYSVIDTSPAPGNNHYTITGLVESGTGVVNNFILVAYEL